MKKNVFSRTLAVLASSAVLGAASMMSASADGESISLTSAEGVPGETVTLEVVVACNNNFESSDVVLSFPSDLTAANAVAVAPCSGSSVAGDDYVTVVSYGSDAIPDGSVATIDFTIPEDAEVGTEYAVTFDTVNVFAIFGGDDIAETVPANGGTITVVAPPEDPTDAPTDEPTETTTEATTTTAAPKKDAAPKTGDNAVVGFAVAGLVAAGAAAVVLKKKN